MLLRLLRDPSLLRGQGLLLLFELFRSVHIEIGTDAVPISLLKNHKRNGEIHGRKTAEWQIPSNTCGGSTNS